MNRRIFVTLRSSAAVAWVLFCVVYGVQSRARVTWAARDQYRQSGVDLFQDAFADELDTMRRQKRIGFVAPATVWSLEPGAEEVSFYYVNSRFALTPALLVEAPFDLIPRHERPSHVQALTGRQGAWSGVEYIILFHSDDALGERFLGALKQSGYDVTGNRRWAKLMLLRKR